MESQFLPLFTKLKRDDENGHHSTLFDSVCMVLRTGFPKICLKDVEKHVDDDRVHCALLLAPGSLEPLKACVQSREVFQLDGSLAGYEALRQSILLDAASDSVRGHEIRICDALVPRVDNFLNHRRRMQKKVMTARTIHPWMMILYMAAVMARAVIMFWPWPRTDSWKSDHRHLHRSLKACC
jgi:hypothetical protein